MITEQLSEDQIWLGCAVCSVVRNSARYGNNIGAILNFACYAKDIIEATALVHAECLENDLVVRGFDYLVCRAYMDDEPSQYEAELIQKLSSYPVQFDDVHTYPADA
jgi:hypothetical protein